MAALEARPGKVGDLVLLVAEGLQGLHGVEVHIRLGVVVGQVGTLPVLIQRSVGFHLQAVAADVVGLQIQDVAQGGHPLLPALVGQAEHQIHGHVAEPGPAGLADGLLGLLVGVGPAQSLELHILVALDANGDAVEARPAELFQGLGRDGVGIGLQGDLGVLFQLEPPVDLRQNPGETLGAEEAGGAAAEIDRVHGVAHHPLGGLLDMGQDGLEVQIHGLMVQPAAQGIKVAVFALAAAKGNMDIQPQGLDLRGGFFWGFVQ